MNKLIALIVCLCSAVSAFKVGKTELKAATALNVRSKSVPFLDQPPALTGKAPGDVGFDPLGLSSLWSDVSLQVVVFMI
jgi:hypothetical protein